MTLTVTNHTHQNQGFGSVSIPARGSAEVPLDLGLQLAQQQHMYPAITVDLSPIASDLPLEDSNGRVYLSLVAPIHTHTGYGHFVASLAKYLIRDPDVVLNLRAYQRHFGGPNMPEEVARAVEEETRLCRVGALMNFPERFAGLASPYRAHIGFYESTNLDDKWIDSARAGFDEIWAFSEFCRDLFEEKIGKPVYLMRGGYDPEEYWYEDMRGGPMKFGIAGRLTGRKCAGELLRTFLRVFDGGEDVELHIKTREFKLDQVVECIDGKEGVADPQYEPTDDPRVHMYYGDWNIDPTEPKPIEGAQILGGPTHRPGNPGMRGFYQGLDVFCFMSHGEGLGLEPLEAMACGCATMATDWSGMADYMNDEYAIPIEVDELESCEGVMRGGGEWAVIDWDQVADKLRWCYDNRDEVARRGKAAASWVRDVWTIERGAQDVKQRLFQLANELG